MKQPYYMVQFTAISCLFEIRVNDVPIFTMELKGQTSTRIPANLGIYQSGVQEISVKMLPLKGEAKLSPGARLDYNVVLYDVSNGFEHKETFEEYRSDAVKSDSIVPLYTHKSTFKATVPYTMKSYWLDGKDLNKVKDLDDKLRASYKRIASLVKDKKFDIFKDKIANREYNMAASMYLSANEAEGRIQRLLNDFKNDYDLIEFPENTVTVYSSYGKRVSLKRLNGDPALSFVNTEEREQVMLDLEFYYSKDTQQFEII
jgi:hypothetical protein